MTAFAGRVAEAMRDPVLHVALGRATSALGLRRGHALASLPEGEQQRDLARAAKLDTLRHLSEHLQRFESALLANGAHVHWARTGTEANEIVIDIARRAQVQRVAKGKSMVSEETHLNDALERAGLTVVETDFGEYIVQLAQDRPSHIVLPIVHMTRETVGRLMHDRLGVPLADDPAVLASYARSRLREEFLRADMGITGANFGVAEDGTICLVTNEGNGRMVTTLPRIHVVLMGIEKLVPSMADLDRFLKLLARSATGQALTAYTTMIRGPRRPQDECGPEQLHVILLDNGRSGMLEGELAEILACIRCGACLNACPVYKSIGGHAYGDTYPGPVGSIVTPGLRGLAGWTELPSASSLCGACRDVCPVRIDIPRMLLSLRRAPAARQRTPFAMRAGMRAFAHLVARPRRYRAAATAVRFLLRRRAVNGWIARAPGLAANWTAIRDLKAPAERTFQQQWQARSVRG